MKRRHIRIFYWHVCCFLCSNWTHSRIWCNSLIRCPNMQVTTRWLSKILPLSWDPTSCPCVTMSNRETVLMSKLSRFWSRMPTWLELFLKIFWKKCMSLIRQGRKFCCKRRRKRKNDEVALWIACSMDCGKLWELWARHRKVSRERRMWRRFCRRPFWQSPRRRDVSMRIRLVQRRRRTWCRSCQAMVHFCPIHQWPSKSHFFQTFFS